MDKGIKKGFYYHKTADDERCFYLTGEKAGNKWIMIGGDDGDGNFVTLPDAQWMSLYWTCIPKLKELEENYTFSETNPTNYILAYKQLTIDEVYLDAKDTMNDTLKKLSD